MSPSFGPDPERLRQHCALLARVARHVIVHGADSWARETAGAVLVFFDCAAGADVRSAWRLLRTKLARVRDGEDEWIRNTEVRWFVERCAAELDFAARRGGRARQSLTTVSHGGEREMQSEHYR